MGEMFFIDSVRSNLTPAAMKDTSDSHTTSTTKNRAKPKDSPTLKGEAREGACYRGGIRREFGVTVSVSKRTFAKGSCRSHLSQ